MVPEYHKIKYALFFLNLQCSDSQPCPHIGITYVAPETTDACVLPLENVI